jgi:hypothetical protein
MVFGLSVMTMEDTVLAGAGVAHVVAAVELVVS